MKSYYLLYLPAVIFFLMPLISVLKADAKARRKEREREAKRAAAEAAKQAAAEARKAEEEARRAAEAAAAQMPKRKRGRPRKNPAQSATEKPIETLSPEQFAAAITSPSEKTNAPESFSCMLAQKFFDKPAAIVGKAVAVTEKLDGVRAVAVIQHGNAVELFTRQGKPIHGLQEVEAAILNAAKANGLTSCTLDGELLITRRENLPSKEQYRQTVKIVRSGNAIKTGITFHVFDIIDPESPLKSYDDRRRALDAIFTTAPSVEALQLVPILARFTARSEQEARETVLKMVAQARAKGQEGVMLNVCAAPYVGKRTASILKAKVFQDCDLKITGFQEGAGRFAGTLGALIVDYKGNALGVGTGFTDAQRAALWQNRAALVGRVVTVQYFEESSDANGKKSLRFPVFKEMREPGKEASYT